MKKIKETVFEDRFVRWFIRSLTGLILVYFTFYIIWKKHTVDVIPFNGTDWAIVIGSITTWAAWEAVRAYLIKKTANGT